MKTLIEGGVIVAGAVVLTLSEKYLDSHVASYITGLVVGMALMIIKEY